VIESGAVKPRRATINDVADEAGVSRSTVSRALTGNGYVSEEIRGRVQEAAARLRYVPDAMARSLRQQASTTIGVLVSNLRDPFYAEMAAGVALSAREAGYTMVLVDDGADPAVEMEAVTRLVELRVAGVIVTPLSVVAVDYLLRNNVPVVEVDRQFAPRSCDAVVVDNRAATRDLTDHLIAQGHTDIALLIDQDEWTTGRERLAGYYEALAEAGLMPRVVRVGWTVESVRADALDLLHGPTPPTALVAVNNVLAEGAYRAIAEAGLRLPQDISLVSFDDVPWMSLVTPGLTAAAQDITTIGQLAAERLLNRIGNPEAPVQTVALAVPLIIRGSTTSPA